MVSFKIKDILGTSEGVKNNVEIYGNIPDMANVAGTSILISQFADLMVRTVLQLDSNNKSDLVNRPVNLPSTSIESLKSGRVYLNDYVDLANRIYGFANGNMTLPAYGNSPLGKVSWQNLIYMYARILAYYKQHNVLPNYAVMSPWTRKPAIGSGAVVIPDELKIYLKETKNCQVSNALVQSIAKGLNGGQAIFNYILRLTYDYYYSTKRGAVQTLKDKVGNCTDLSHALIALARAKGIPARYVHNTSVKFPSITTGHVWAELYINGKWIFADASNNANLFGVNPKNSQLLGTTKRYAELPF